MAARKATIKPAATGNTPAGDNQIAIASTATIQDQLANPRKSGASSTSTPAAGEPKPKHAGGRPTKYYPELCDDLIQYFGATEDPWTESLITMAGKSWSKVETKLIPQKLPTLEAWCWYKNIHTGVIYEWCDRYPEFMDAVSRAKNWQKNLIIQGGMCGVYDSKFTQFIATNLTDMRNSITMDGTLVVQHLRSPEERELLATMAAQMARQIAQNGNAIAKQGVESNSKVIDITVKEV